MIIAVVGDGRCPKEVADRAEAVGRALAEAGAVLVCGGLGGVMEAACRGAKREGGTTIGILPGLVPGDANPFVDIPIVTGMGQNRNLLVVASAGAVVAVSGGYGTLSEIALALKHGIPVVGLGTWPLGEEHIETAETPADAAAKALALAHGSAAVRPRFG